MGAAEGAALRADPRTHGPLSDGGGVPCAKPGMNAPSPPSHDVTAPPQTVRKVSKMFPNVPRRFKENSKRF